MLIVWLLGRFLIKKWYRGSSVSVFHKLNLIKQTTRTYCVQCKKKTENLNPKTFKKWQNNYAIKTCCVWICERSSSKRFIE